MAVEEALVVKVDKRIKCPHCHRDVLLENISWKKGATELLNKTCPNCKKLIEGLITHELVNGEEQVVVTPQKYQTNKKKKP